MVRIVIGIGVVIIVLLAVVYGLPRAGEATDSEKQKARRLCTERVERMPPQPFTSDGCSAWPDWKIRDCCVRHDMDYWCGGDPSYRVHSDARFAQCVAESYTYFPSGIIHTAVRLNGWRYFPVPWRWGYGRPWPFFR